MGGVQTTGGVFTDDAREEVLGNICRVFGCGAGDVEDLAPVQAGMHDQFFEDALVQMIMFHDFQLRCVDVAGERWAEVDSVDDLLVAQQIHRESAV